MTRNAPIRRRRTARGVAALFTAASLLLAGCSDNGQAGQVGSFVFVSPGGKIEFSYPASERQTIGDFTGPSVTDPNTTIALSQFPNTVMVLNYWGSWCAPCQAEAPDLNVAAELSADRPVQFLGINVKDTLPAAADFISGFEVSFPSIFDAEMRTLLSMGGYPTNGIPSTIVLDRQHRVARIYLRVVTAQELDEAIQAVLAEDTAAAAPTP